jgi:hypothetical protein
LKVEELSALPDELRTQLRDSVITLEPAQISSAIERVSQENRALGLALARYAERGAYSKIFRSIITESEADALLSEFPPKSAATNSAAQ